MNTYSDHKYAKEPFRKEQPSDQAIADAFWYRSICQTHGDDACAFVEEVYAAALRIDAGLPPIEPNFEDRFDAGVDA